MEPLHMKLAGGVCACASLLSIIIFAVCMGSYVHLGPNDQVVLRMSTGKYVQNGPWSGQLHPFHKKVWRKATLLDPLEYAIVEDTLTSIKHLEAGPKLLFLGPNDEVLDTKPKIVLEKHEYIRLTNRMTGEERVVHGPNTVVPVVSETHTGVQTAHFVNIGSALIIRNKLTGEQSLITSCKLPSGVWYPAPLEEMVDVRELIHVLPHEALVVRDVDGNTKVYSGRETQAAGCDGSSSNGVGGAAFFLPPFSKIVRMRWSRYADMQATLNGDTRRLSVGADGEPIMERVDFDFEMEEFHADYDGQAMHKLGAESRRLSKERVHVYDKTRGRRLESIYVDQASPSMSSAPQTTVTAVDLRTRKSFYRYEVRTSDNVRLMLEGTLFWRIKDVRAMLVMSADPEGDVWSKSRSTLIGAISTVDLQTFMTTFNDVVINAFENTKNNVFWLDRGIDMISIELNNYKPLDEHTAHTLQSIIRQTVGRMNDLQQQQSKNDVLREKLEADTSRERNKTQLLETQAENSRMIADMRGAKIGGKSSAALTAFVNGLETSVTNITERVNLYKYNYKMEASQRDAEQLTASGDSMLYMAPKDMVLRLQIPTGAHDSN